MIPRNHNITYRFTFSISFILFFFLVKPSIAATSDLSTVKVRDFKFYREYQYKNSRILIHKKSKLIRILFLNKNNTAVNLTQSKSKSLFQYSTESKKATHFVVFKHAAGQNKFSYFAKDKQKYFQSSNNEQCANYKSAISKIDIDLFTAKLATLQIKSLLDPKSCKDPDSPMISNLSDALTQSFDPESDSSLVSCLNLPAVQSIIDKDQSLENMANQAMGKFLQLSDGIFTAKKPIQIRCNMPDKEKTKIASFDNSKDPVTISFNLTNPKIFNNLTQKSVNDLLSHELFHYSEQFIPTFNNTLDELMVNNLNCLCKEAIDKKITADDISKKCPIKKGLATSIAMQSLDKTEEMRASLTTTGTSDKSSTGLIAATEAQNRTREAVVEAAIKQTIAPATFTPVEPSAVEHLANVPHRTLSGAAINENNYGKTHTVYPSPRTLNYLNTVYDQFSKGANATTAALNKAVAMTTNTAQAQTSQQNLRAATTQSPKTNFAAGPPSYPKIELVHDLLDPDFDRPHLSNSTSTTLAANTTSKVGPQRQETRKQSQVDLTSGSTTSVSGFANTDSKPSTVVAPSSTLPTQLSTNSDAGTNSKSRQPSVRSIASLSTNQKNFQPADILSGMSKISGQQYKSITNLYTDADFNERLRQREISIIVRRKNKKDFVIGLLASSKAKEKFIDDGQKLEKTLTKK
ncbi:MAG: hypothetical protein H7235_04520 [Bdellovibrionaceae bacterium]|nr:hypothetical protein [Pseudobdellovibrionaceae bacterium]